MVRGSAFAVLFVVCGSFLFELGRAVGRTQRTDEVRVLHAQSEALRADTLRRLMQAYPPPANRPPEPVAAAAVHR